MSLENVHNYYEKLLEKEIIKRGTSITEKFNEEDIEDIACIAMNKLPPRYIRHDVDVLFFMSSKELQEMQDKVETALSDAIEFVTAHPRKE